MHIYADNMQLLVDTSVSKSNCMLSALLLDNSLARSNVDCVTSLLNHDFEMGIVMVA